MKNRLFVFIVVLNLVILCFSSVAFAVNFEDVPADGSVHEFDLSVGYASLFPDAPFTSDHYIIISAAGSYYLIDVPELDSVDYTFYSSGSSTLLYVSSSVRMIGVDQLGQVYYFTFSYNDSTCTYKLIGDDNYYGTEVSYSIMPAVYTSGEGDSFVSYDLYLEMGFKPDTMVTYQVSPVEESYFSVYLYIIIFLLVALFLVGLFKNGGRH